MKPLIQKAIGDGSHTNFSLEERSLEFEYEWYLTFADIEEVVADLPRVHIEQVEHPLRNDAGAKLGVLRGRRFNHEDIVMTIKRKSDQGAIESTVDGDPDLFSTIKSLANVMYQKVRYYKNETIHHNGQPLTIGWEIDRYLRPDQSFDPVVKIDLEVPDPSIRPPALPWRGVLNCHAFNGSDTHHGSGLSAEEQAWLDVFFARVQHPLSQQE